MLGIDAECLQERMQRQQMQTDAINDYVEGFSEDLLRQDSWEKFNAAEVAETSLQMPMNADADDGETQRFRTFLSIATNFSSLPLAAKLNKVPELVESIKTLLESMIKEVQQYSDIANELRDLIHCFIRMVMQVKHNVNMILPLLSAARKQLSVVEDVMNTDPSQILNETDKNDIKLALDRMSNGIENLLELAKSSKAESQKLDERIHTMTNSVQSRKFVVQGRLDIAEFCFKNAKPAGAVSGALAAGGLLVSEARRGFGALIVAGTASPPVAAIISASALGGIGAATVVTLVKTLWARHQHNALMYLGKIFESLVQLNAANTYFIGYMTDAEEKAIAVSQHLQDIQLCLESERQRRINRDVCTRAIESTTTMINSLKEISTIDISEWTGTTNVISLSAANETQLSITN
ncbi:unnamed protein product [Adineta steineri]|uniref:Uncharacterized protein n=1 Tax=Adineta steineri TaxID=433720 RepID=A0A815CCP9_9BILA|nr:unnamed protein product [Adineta steineri]CAF1281923.1 unnamed protein product [Adineta steineri]